jgi:hypothetical protein
VGRRGRPSTARRPPDRTQIIWGMCLITDFRTAGRRKFKFGGQEGETDYSTALPGSDPNYLGRPLWRALLASDASLGIWATDCGRRADSSTRFPGASSFFCFEPTSLNLIDLILFDSVNHMVVFPACNSSIMSDLVDDEAVKPIDNCETEHVCPNFDVISRNTCHNTQKFALVRASKQCGCTGFIMHVAVDEFSRKLTGQK